jgi:hypothetical protein
MNRTGAGPFCTGWQQALSDLRPRASQHHVPQRTTTDRKAHENKLITAKKLSNVPCLPIIVKIAGKFEQISGFAH